MVSAMAIAQDGNRYRVEILVLEHIGHSEPAFYTLKPRDYSAALDFSYRPSTPVRNCLDFRLNEHTVALPAPLGTVPDPEKPAEVTDMGPEMSDAWRRVRLSAPFRPLQYRAWEQSEDEPFPTVRIHDNALVWTDDLEARFEALEAEDELIPLPLEPLPPAEAAGSLPVPVLGPPCSLVTLPDLWPGAVPYYGLDGTIRLRRSRFFHLDIELRQSAEAPDGPLAVDASENAGGPVVEGTPLLQVHELIQSRQVRSGRMEYFDGPVIAVLAWITSIPLAEPEERL